MRVLLAIHRSHVRHEQHLPDYAEPLSSEYVVPDRGAKTGLRVTNLTAGSQNEPILVPRALVGFGAPHCGDRRSRSSYDRA